MSVVVVGAGISGAACARELRAAGRSVRVLDRGRVPGGRLASRHLAGRVVDHGASYFTVSEPAFREVVEGWEQGGLARPWTDTFHTATPSQGLTGVKTGPMRWAAPGGLRSLVVDLVGESEQEHLVKRVGPGPTVDGVTAETVVLAMPDPQAARLLDPSLAAARAVAGREWQPVLALVVVCAERVWEPTFDGAFVSGSQVLEWVADDGRRRGDGAPVLVAHSAPSWTTGDVDEMVRELELVLGVRLDVQETQLTRWGFAKPAGSREEPFFLDEGVGLCGDGWGRSKVETAYLSGRALGQSLLG